MPNYNSFNRITNSLKIRQSSYMSGSLGSSSFGERARTAIDKIVIAHRDGIVETLYTAGDNVFAVIRKNHPPEKNSAGESIGDTDGLFNAPDGVPEDKLKLPEILIPINLKVTDLWNINAFIGSTCQVELVNGTAVNAYIGHQRKYATLIKPEQIKNARKFSPDGEIVSEEARNFLKSVYGFNDQHIDNMLIMAYVPDEHKGKVLSVKGDAVRFKDTSLPQDYEVILESNSNMNGLNNLEMKSKECHMPSSFLSGK